jgi:hypothetical protein
MRRAALTVAILLLGACSASETTESSASGNSTTTAADGGTTSTTQPGATPTTLTPVAPVATVQAAIDDLAARLDVDPSRVRLIESEQVTWPDGSLGCPRPGELYTQALVEGYRVVVSHEDRAFDYHAGADDVPFLCPTDEKDGGYEFIPSPGFDT